MRLSEIYTTRVTNLDNDSLEKGKKQPAGITIELYQENSSFQKLSGQPNQLVPRLYKQYSFMQNFA